MRLGIVGAATTNSLPLNLIKTGNELVSGSPYTITLNKTYATGTLICVIGMDEASSNSVDIIVNNATGTNYQSVAARDTNSGAAGASAFIVSHDCTVQACSGIYLAGFDGEELCYAVYWMPSSYIQKWANDNPVTGNYTITTSAITATDAWMLTVVAQAEPYSSDFTQDTGNGWVTDNVLENSNFPSSGNAFLISSRHVGALASQAVSQIVETNDTNAKSVWAAVLVDTL